jgi:ABC-type Fe3+-hydroxamate transport system substrate-binding protein
LSRYKKSKIVAYGASATSTTLISHFKLFNFIDYLVDDNPGKINTFSPGYHIPVYNSKKIATDKPDVIIILAWRYKKEILKKLKKNYYKNKNIAVPLPKFNI